jgi:hypothetical protein
MTGYTHSIGVKACRQFVWSTASVSELFLNVQNYVRKQIKNTELFFDQKNKKNVYPIGMHINHKTQHFKVHQVLCHTYCSLFLNVVNNSLQKKHCV